MSEHRDEMTMAVIFGEDIQAVAIKHNDFHKVPDDSPSQVNEIAR